MWLVRVTVQKNFLYSIRVTFRTLKAIEEIIAMAMHPRITDTFASA
jgi:hypothetical protein